MFDEATVFINDGFVKGGPTIFNQLDTVMRHELANNLMMHQIRMMHVFKQQHANTDPEYAYNQIASSMSLHELLNWLEDFEISNERYSAADKKIAKDLLFEAVDTVDEAIKLAEKNVGTDYKVVLMPQGSLTVPLLKKD
jgi:hypothetical protein